MNIGSIDKTDSAKATPLILAVQNQQVLVAEYLIIKGASVHMQVYEILLHIMDY